MSFFEEEAEQEVSTNELSLPDAFTAVPLAMSAVDGSIDETEMECVGTYIQRMKIFEDYDNEQIATMFSGLLEILDQQGALYLIKAAKLQLPPPLRETAFACAVDVAFADGILSDGEKKLLNELCRFLEVPEKTASMIIKVAMIRNRGYGQW